MKKLKWSTGITLQNLSFQNRESPIGELNETSAIQSSSNVCGVQR